jgi:hypothetical protein
VRVVVTAVNADGNGSATSRFRGDGRFVVTLGARDKSGRTSLPARRVLWA